MPRSYLVNTQRKSSRGEVLLAQPMATPEATPVAIIPRLNKRNPQELHWRKEVPEWKGNIEFAYEYYYGHLDDMVLCRHCGAIPCPVDHEEDKKQRIADLQFVRDLVKEKKELEKQLLQMDEQVDEMVQKIARWRVDREEMAEKIRELNMTNKNLSEEKVTLKGEVKRLQHINIKNQAILADYAKIQQSLKDMTEKVGNLEEQTKTQEHDVRKYRQMVVKQADEIDELAKQNKMISTELADVRRMASANQTDFDAAMAERESLRAELEGKDDEIQRVRQQVQDVISDLEAKVTALTEKDQQNEELIRELRSEIQRLKESFDTAQKSVIDLQENAEKLMAEITRLQNKMANDMRFRKYVEIKREYNDLKDYNQSLEQRINIESQSELPVLLSKGKVSTLGQSFSSKHSTRRRIKSAVVFRPTTRGIDQENVKDLCVKERIDKINNFVTRH